MADNGTFTGKLELKLVNMSTLTPFSESVEFESLKGLALEAVEVSISSKDKSQCFSLNKYCHNPVLLIIRPIKARFTTTGKSGDVLGDWEDLIGPKPDRDKLACFLSFQVGDAGQHTVRLGRPQFYYDGLIDQLFVIDGKKEYAKLTFKLDPGYGLDKDGGFTGGKPNDPPVVKKLDSVMTQLIVGNRDMSACHE